MGLCAAGEAKAQDIDEFVERWHRSRSAMTLYDYLGMTESEYADWVRRPEILPTILKVRRQQFERKDRARPAKVGVHSPRE
jgi:hypothetical protein